jgi:hypothetical protein
VSIRAHGKNLSNTDRQTQAGLYLDNQLKLGRAQVDYGEIDSGIRSITEVYQAVGDFSGEDSLRAQVAFNLGIAWLRQAETENCCANNAPESCILPLRGAAIHTRTEGSRSAIKYLTEAIELSGDNEALKLSARWLVNLAYMTLGDYPSNTPEAVRLPSAILESDIPFPRFENIASSLGLATDGLAGGGVADDLENDGDFDLLVSDWRASAPLRYFENKLAEGFVERTDEAGLTGIRGGLNMVQADYDNDGDLDVLILRGAWLGNEGEIPNSLLRNEGGGNFVDVTFASGLAFTNYPSQTAAWFDYDYDYDYDNDNDGDLDIYIGNERAGDKRVPCQLFRNESDGTFLEATHSAGVANNRFCKAVVCGDVDNDNWPDLVVSNYRDENRLYRNNRDGTFTDVALELGVSEPLTSFPAWIWDYDNDGAVDIFISSYTAGTQDYARKALGEPYLTEISGHYRGDGKGGFTNLAAEQGFEMPMPTMGVNFGDLDNDGFLDLYLGSGLPDIDQVIPNSLFLNQGGTMFADVTMASGLGHLQKGHAVAFVDFDHDGDQDVFEQMGGAKRVDSFRNALYENPGFGNHWVSVRLIGIKSNRSAIGARIRIDLDEGGEKRSVYRHVNSGASFGANPLTQHIGVGKAGQIERMEILWPMTGETQAFENLPVDRTFQVTEDSDELIQR